MARNSHGSFIQGFVTGTACELLGAEDRLYGLCSFARNEGDEVQSKARNIRSVLTRISENCTLIRLIENFGLTNPELVLLRMLYIHSALKTIGASPVPLVGSVTQEPQERV